MTRRVVGGVCLGVLLVLAAVWARPASAQAPRALRPVAESEMPALLDVGDYASLQEAIVQNLVWLERRPPQSTFAFGSRTITVGEQVRALGRMLELLADDPTPDALEALVLEEFDVLRSAGRNDGTVLVTGYHEPIVDAALQPSAEYRVPILAAPSDLSERSSAAPAYPTRAEIESGGLAGQARPLAWARDPIDVFFLEVEGSGTLRLTDGSEIRIGYAGTNRRPYRSIGRLLIDEGHIEREAMSMRALREWLQAHPDQLSRVLHHNPSYVFFARRAGPPVGSLGVPLTPGRSIATDPHVFPPGSLAFLLTERPRPTVDGEIAWGPVSRFVLSQDAGGVIRGPGRVDVFWGRGAEADLAASEMKQSGELYVLVPKAPGARRPPSAKRDHEREAETKTGEAEVRVDREPPPADAEADPRWGPTGAFF